MRPVHASVGRIRTSPAGPPLPESATRDSPPSLAANPSPRSGSTCTVCVAIPPGAFSWDGSRAPGLVGFEAFSSSMAGVGDRRRGRPYSAMRFRVGCLGGPVPGTSSPSRPRRIASAEEARPSSCFVGPIAEDAPAGLSPSHPPRRHPARRVSRESTRSASDWHPCPRSPRAKPNARRSARHPAGEEIPHHPGSA